MYACVCVFSPWGHNTKKDKQKMQGQGKQQENKYCPWLVISALKYRTGGRRRQQQSQQSLGTQ